MNRSAILAVVLGAATLACDPGMIRGEGDVTSETRDVAAFSRVEASAGVQVTIGFGPTASLEVRAQENILPLIETKVTNGTLRIDTERDYTSAERVDVVLVTDRLEALLVSGGAHGSIDGLAADAFDMEASGGSRVTATGSAGSIALEISGGSVAELADLAAKNVTVDLSGGSRAEVRASDHVQGSASGGSRATVFGDAQVSVDTTDGSQVGPG